MIFFEKKKKKMKCSRNKKTKCNIDAGILWIFFHLFFFSFKNGIFFSRWSLALFCFQIPDVIRCLCVLLLWLILSRKSHVWYVCVCGCFSPKSIRPHTQRPTILNEYFFRPKNNGRNTNKKKPNIKKFSNKNHDHYY